MIKHYLKIAFRNLLKYKTQNVISIIGLAVGFTCFVLATLWIQYEMTYDNFHKDVDKMFLVRGKSTYHTSGISNSTPYPLGSYLKNTYPEIDKACNVNITKGFLKLEESSQIISLLGIDSAYMQMFRIQVKEGNMNFIQDGKKEIAITEKFAHELFGNESPLEKVLNIGNTDYKICAVVSGWSKHSNMPYDVLTPLNIYRSGWGNSVCTFIQVTPQKDMNEFMQKLNKVKLTDINSESDLGNLILTPLKAIRYSDFYRNNDLVMSFNNILYFCVAGGLIILCSLFNYLTLFISNLRMRGREMALRKVCGSSNHSLLGLFSVEVILLLMIAMFFGMILIELVSNSFIKFSEIEIDKTELYAKSILYLGGVIIVTFITAQVPIIYFRKNTLAANIQGKSIIRKGSRNISQKLGLVLQLVISILFIFSTVVILKQLHFIKNTDANMERHNIGSVALWMSGDINAWTDKIAALPMITEALPPQYFPLLPTGPMMYMDIKTWDGKDASSDKISLGMVLAKEPFFKFYNIKLVKGEFINEKSLATDIVINESTVKAFGWKDPIGKLIEVDKNMKFKVVGVVKDLHYVAPTVKTPLIGFVLTDKQKYMWMRASILFKFKEGTWKECKAAIDSMHKADFPTAGLRLFNEEDEYNKYLKSENSLLKMLGVATIVCILISAFGIFSQITLSCEKRRKEVAIRKVNGAGVKDILAMFIKEYFLILGIAAMIAFPTGYVLMKKWLESYMEQTEINSWIYVSILTVVALIIFSSIGWRIWKAARQNPAEVIKSE
ncbi:MAG: FtsX-like permease family protein [Bacteroides sp.]